MTDLIERLAEVEDRLAARGNIQADANARTIDEAIAALAEKDARIADLMAENKNLGNEIDNLEAEGCDYDDTIRNLETQLTASRAECEGLQAALAEAQKTMRNCQGAIESNQVEDKDVRRQLIRGQSAIDAALASLSQPAKGAEGGGRSQGHYDRDGYCDNPARGY